MRAHALLTLLLLCLLCGCGDLVPAYQESFVYAAGPNPYITVAADRDRGFGKVAGFALPSDRQAGGIAVWHDLVVAVPQPDCNPASLATYRHSDTGELLELAEVRISSDGFQVCPGVLRIAPSGRFVYLLFGYVDGYGNRGDAVGILGLDPVSGALKPVWMRLLPGSGHDMKLSPDGTVLCVDEAIGHLPPAGAISCASVDSESGIVGTFNNYYVGDWCCSINFSPDGRFLAAAHAGTIQVYSVQPGATLAFPALLDAPTGDTVTFGSATTALEFDPSGTYIAISSNYVNNDVSVLRFDAQAMTLTPVPSSPFRFSWGQNAGQIAFAPSGVRLFTLNRAAYPDCTTILNAFSFDKSTGVINTSRPLASIELPADPPCYSSGTFAVSAQ